MPSVDDLNLPIKHCAKCRSKFSFQEFSSYMLRSVRSRTTFCLDCQTENYITQRNNSLLRNLRLAAAFVGIFTFILLMKIVMDISTVRDTAGEVIGYTIVRMVGGFFVSIILSAIVREFLLKILDWNYSPTSTDRNQKSAYDYQ